MRRPIWHPAWMAVKHPLEPVARFLWIYAVGMLAFSSMTSVMALYLGATFGLDERTIGYVFLYVGVLSFTMRSLLLGPIVDRIGEGWAMRIGTLLLIAGLFLYPVAQEHRIPGAGDSARTDRHGAALSRDHVAHVAALRSGRARDDDGRRADVRGLARVAAPLLSTAAFQRLGHGWPFYIAGGYVTLVGLMAFRIPNVRGVVAQPRTEGGAQAG